MNIAICDDEEIYVKRIEEGISRYSNLTKHKCDVTCFNSGKDFIALGESIIKYDLIFLDVRMENGDGLEVARHIRKYSESMLIVFVSAFVDYSVQGYHFNALRYILKDKMMTKAIEESLDAAVSRIGYEGILIEEAFDEGKVTFAVSNLLYIESIKHWLYFHICDGDDVKEYKVYRTMKSIEDKYIPFKFLEVRKGFLVNMKNVKDVVRCELILINGETIIIPKAKYRMVKESIMAYREGL